MALGLTQPLTEMSIRNILWGDKGGQCIGLTTLSISCAYCLESGTLKLLEPSGPVQACNGIALSLPYIYLLYFILFYCIMQLNLHTHPPSENTKAHLATTLIGLPHTLAIHYPLYPYQFCFSTCLFLSCWMLKINVL